MTIFRRLGRGHRGSDNKVFLPMITGNPVVICLNLFRSLGRWKRRSLFLPMAKFLAMATMIEIFDMDIMLVSFAGKSDK
jgi:uncharacterized membrane protein YoaK (UPF0700 family)